MSDTTYNGWTNWETWNAALWADNDEETYRLRRRSGIVTANDVKGFFEQIWPEGFTPDGADLDEVNFEEILEAWEEE